MHLRALLGCQHRSRRRIALIASESALRNNGRTDLIVGILKHDHMA
jgi:hypothetical protein